MVNIPVVFSFDSRIILGAAVSIKSLIDCAKEDTCYDIRIFHSDLDIQSLFTILIQTFLKELLITINLGQNSYIIDL